MLRKTMSEDIVDINGNPIGIELVDILVKVGFCKSKTEGRKLIKGGAIKLNDVKVNSPFARLFKYEEISFLIEGCEYEIISITSKFWLKEESFEEPSIS
jgi:ribosomal protein S4